jgi:hypothetical protein
MWNNLVFPKHHVFLLSYGSEFFQLQLVFQVTSLTLPHLTTLTHPLTNGPETLWTWLRQQSSN